MLTLGDKIIAGSFKAGASWEVGDVGISAFGIDEALNKRRYLNGQVISQAQFVEFTAMLKSRVSLYPNLATTEENWQAEVTNSKLGQCGKFVIDDDAGTIRLPKVVNINGLQNLTGLGGIKAESLPNITGKVSQYDTGSNLANSVSGAFYAEQDTGTSGGYSGWNTGTNNKEKFDASRSSSTYQDDAPVQQEAVQYPYFIQVAEGVETSIDVSREIELTNPFTLFQYQWSSFILNNASWLRADTFSWQSGAVYVSAYEQLLTEYNAGTSETAEGITYRLTSTGKKIALADQETAIVSLYTSTGKAWYYILDTENERFKLPRGLHGTVVQSYQNGTDWYRIYSDGWCEQGGIISGIGSIDFIKTYTTLVNIKSPFSYNSSSNGVWVTSPSTTGFTVTGAGNALNTAILAGNNYWQACGYIVGDFNDIEKYLYFYVGETVQDANLINAGVIPEYVSSLRTVHAVIDTYQNGTSWYRVYDDGWCEQGGRNAVSGDGNYTVNLLKSFRDTNYSLTQWSGFQSTISNQYNNGLVVTSMTDSSFTYNSYDYNSTLFWQACGYLAEGEF